MGTTSETKMGTTRETKMGFWPSGRLEVPGASRRQFPEILTRATLGLWQHLSVKVLGEQAG